MKMFYIKYDYANEYGIQYWIIKAQGAYSAKRKWRKETRLDFGNVTIKEITEDITELEFIQLSGKD